METASKVFFYRQRSHLTAYTLFIELGHLHGVFRQQRPQFTRPYLTFHIKNSDPVPDLQRDILMDIVWTQYAVQTLSAVTLTIGYWIIVSYPNQLHRLYATVSLTRHLRAIGILTHRNPFFGRGIYLPCSGHQSVYGEQTSRDVEVG
jgi:hypothetical protein